MQNSKWMSYPGDFEVWLSEKVYTDRRYRGVIIPPYWRMSTHYKNLRFYSNIEIKEPITIHIEAQGIFSFAINYNWQRSEDGYFTIPEGTHALMLAVYSVDPIPAIKVSGLQSCEWVVEYGDKINVPVAYTDRKPDGIDFSLEEIFPVKLDGKENIWDFGKETIGLLKFNGLSGNGKIRIFYGESPEEAHSEEFCENLDVVEINNSSDNSYTHNRVEAFRYVMIKAEGTVKFTDLTLMYHHLPLEHKGSFKCSDEQLNKIWDISLYTLELNTREFFLDGVKRDRWVWSGDAYQCFLMNYFTFFDNDVSKRTLRALLGKEPYTKHINHITDYTFYWFISLYDYYIYTKDLDFIRSCFDNAVKMMDFCLSRRDDNGYMNSRADDWVFLDWAPMDLTGVVTAEQVLFCRSLECMGILSKLTGIGDSEKYLTLFNDIKEKISADFWSDEEGFRHCDHEHHSTKYANMFALMYDYLDDGKKEIAASKSLMNPTVQPVTTPYARFYQLDALCKCGEFDYVLDEIKTYWGGMIDLGATTFWEEYNPEQTGAEHLAFYDRPFGKSLCHAWGASPLYLLGKYFLGVMPTSPGYETYEINLYKGNMEFIEGIVPTPIGNIEIFYSDNEIRIKPLTTKGILRYKHEGIIHEVSLDGNFFNVNLRKG